MTNKRSKYVTVSEEELVKDAWERERAIRNLAHNFPVSQFNRFSIGLRDATAAVKGFSVDNDIPVPEVWKDWCLIEAAFRLWRRRNPAKANELLPPPETTAGVS